MNFIQKADKNIPALKCGDTSIQEGSEFGLPMQCAVKDAPFTIRFLQNSFTGDYYFDRILTRVQSRIEQTGQSSPLLNLPLSKLSFDNLSCPHCSTPLGIVQCGKCRQFVCYGLTDHKANQTNFRCRASCGHGGPVSEVIQKVVGYGGTPSSLPPSHQIPVSSHKQIPKG